MALLGYNKRLFWVVWPLLIWAYWGLFAALGAEQQEQGLLKLSLGLPEGAVTLAGELRQLTEETDEVTLVLALPPGAPELMRGPEGESYPELPPGLTVEYVSTEDAAPGPPQIHLLKGDNRPLTLPAGRQLVSTARYVFVFDRHGVRVWPASDRPKLERLKQRLLEREEGRPDRPPPGERWRPPEPR